jgi:Zn-dependent metalloprotease
MGPGKNDLPRKWQPEGARMTRKHLCFVVPSYVLFRVIEEGQPELRAHAASTLAISERLRERRAVTRRLVQHEPQAAPTLLLPQVGERRTVYDMHNGGQGDLPGTKVRGEGGPPVADVAVNEAYDGAGTTFDFYESAFNRNSVDDKGLELVSSVHFETNYDNAFWDGAQMVYGDGDGQMFKKGGFTKCLDVIGHELTHGVTQFTAGLRYRSQSGALNESMSDVFGSLVKQHSMGQTADKADWLIGEGILGPQLPGQALRSLKAPGTAFQFDNQPADMDHYVELADDGDPRHDHGGVHINSGIPNHAFYLAAVALGGNAWEKAGSIWYRTLATRLNENSDFQAAADATVAVSAEMFTPGGPEQQAVRRAWEQVGITPA